MKPTLKTLSAIITMMIAMPVHLLAQSSVGVGAQITRESDLVDGGKYVLQSQASGNPYITDTGSDYSVPNGGNQPTSASVYYFFKNTDGTWRIRNQYTGKFWGVPVYNQKLAPAIELEAGAWSMNFSGAIAYPRANAADGTTVLSIDRSSQRIVGWTTKTSGNAAQSVKIYEVDAALSSEPLLELEHKMVAVSATPANDLATGQWYTIYDRGLTGGTKPHGYLYENSDSHKLFNTATAPSGLATKAAKYLLRLTDAGDGNYYIQNGFGNYFGTIEHNTQVAVVAGATEAIAVKKIAGTDGHFYLQGVSTGVILDANDLSAGDAKATVVGWGTTVPTATGGNNDWAFYPVELDDIPAEIALFESDVTVRRGYQTTGRGNADALLLRIDITPSQVLQKATFRFALDAATRDNISSLYLYDTKETEFLANIPAAPVGSASEIGATTDIKVENITAGLHRLWLCATVKDDAQLGAILKAALTTIDYTTSADASFDAIAIGNPDRQGMKVFDQQLFIFKPTTDDCRYYRIPAMVLDKEGNIVVASDRRYSSNADLGNHKIDVSIRRSVDGGRTWSAQNLIAVGDGRNSATYGYGDPALVRTANGRIVCLMAAGKNGYFSSMRNIGICTSDDNGVTWTPVRELTTSNFTDATHNLTNQLGFWSIFTTSGKGLLKRDGTVMFTTNTLPSSGTSTSNCVIISSTDEGEHWTLGPATAYAGGDESKLEEMNDGSLLISVRQSGARGFNTGNADGTEWGTQWRNSQITANACNADILYYSRSIDNERDIMLHTYLKNTGSRQNLTLAMSIDQGQNWTDVMNIQPGGCAYSTMVRLTNGDLAILYEDESYSAGNGYAQTFLTITAEQIKAMYDELKGDTEQEDYERALAKLEDGGVYCFTTSYLNDEHVRGIYYLKADGTLTTDFNQAKYFTFQKTALSGGYKPFGWKSGQFTNPSNATTNTKYIRTDWQNRDDWEAQAILLNEDGLYAIRSTNAPTENTWGSNAWWTTDSEGNATYDLAGGKHFIWDIVKVGTTPTFDAAETYRILDANECYMAEVESGKLTTAYLLKDDFVISPVANKKGVFTLQDKTAGKYVGAPTEVGFWTLGSTAAECHIQEVEHDGKTAYMIQAPYNNHFDNAAAVLSDAAGVENFSESTAAFVMSDNDLSHALYWTIRTTEEDIALGISQVNTDNSAATAVFSPNGMRQQQLQRGLNIVRHADGKVTKVIRR